MLEFTFIIRLTQALFLWIFTFPIECLNCMRNGILNGISSRVDILITIHYKITFIRVKIYAMLAIQRQTRTICFLVTSTRSTRVINQKANEYGGFQSIRCIREKNGFVDRIALVIPRITNKTVFWNLDAIHACLATLLLENVA